MDARQCRRLYEHNILEFNNNELKVHNLNSIAKQVPLHGTVYKSDGTCYNAQSFDLRGRHFPNNYIVAVLKGEVTVQRRNYSPVLNEITLEGKPISLSKGLYEGRLDTFIWELPQSSCQFYVEEIYTGTSQYIVPKNDHLHKQVVVRDSKRGLSFALDVAKPKDICGAQFFETQLNDIYVSLSVDNFLSQVEPTIRVDKLDNIIG